LHAFILGLCVVICLAISPMFMKMLSLSSGT